SPPHPGSAVRGRLRLLPRTPRRSPRHPPQTAIDAAYPVLGIFQPDRHPDRAFVDSGCLQRFFVELSVSGAGRMDHERTAVTHVGEVAEEPKTLDEPAACLPTTLQRERQNSPCTTREHQACEVVVRVAGKDRKSTR